MTFRTVLMYIIESVLNYLADKYKQYDLEQSRRRADALRKKAFESTNKSNAAYLSFESKLTEYEKRKGRGDDNM